LKYFENVGNCRCGNNKTGFKDLMSGILTCHVAFLLERNCESIKQLLALIQVVKERETIDSEQGRHSSRCKTFWNKSSCYRCYVIHRNPTAILLKKKEKHDYMHPLYATLKIWITDNVCTCAARGCTVICSSSSESLLMSALLLHSVTGNNGSRVCRAFKYKSNPSSESEPMQKKQTKYSNLIP